jgi:hypothetical protein
VKKYAVQFNTASDVQRDLQKDSWQFNKILTAIFLQWQLFFENMQNCPVRPSVCDTSDFPDLSEEGARLVFPITVCNTSSPKQHWMNWEGGNFFFAGVKLSGREANRLPPFRSEAKNALSRTPLHIQLYTECPKSYYAVKYHVPRCTSSYSRCWKCPPRSWRQYTSGAVKKCVQTCLQARGGHFQHLL